MRKQDAIWWKRGSSPDRFGQYSFDPPVGIKCRWEDGVGVFVQKESEKQSPQSTVYVDRDMSVGDRLQLGTLDSETPSDPMDSTTAYEIQRFDILPNLKNTEKLRTAYLQWQPSSKSRASTR